MRFSPQQFRVHCLGKRVHCLGKLVALLIVALFANSLGTSNAAGALLLDGDTPATGSNLDTMPLVTPFGVVSFVGELNTLTDDDFTAVGASGNNFNIDDPDDSATLSFSFSVDSATFIYGGNNGVFDILALNGGGVVVDSFLQASTGNGQPAGPITLTGPGIRSLTWKDPNNNFAAIDNLELKVPEPTAILLLSLGLGLLANRWNKTV